MQNASEEMLVRTRGALQNNVENDWKQSQGGEEAEKESIMMELTRLVQKTVKESSWWERKGIDCSILALAFLCLPPGRTPDTKHFKALIVKGCESFQQNEK